MPGADPKRQLKLSVQDRAETSLAHEAPLVFFMANLADGIPPWPGKARDIVLDNFWRQESMLSGAIYSMCSKLKALDFKLRGPRKAVNRYYTILQSADLGNGWLTFISKVVLDILTQDNGGYIEILRPSRASPASAASGIAHLDSQRCEQTGNPEQPVNYEDSSGRIHRLRWYEVVPMVDLPSAREENKNWGFCAVSRVLRAAQIIRDIGLYKRQKLSGKRIPAVLFVQGIRHGAIEEAIQMSSEREIQTQGRTIYTGPVVISGNDPGQRLEAQLIELAGLPDGYNEDDLYKWYITTMAIGFGTDYSEFAPLPGGNLGTASQVESMSAKSRGKGPGAIIQQFEYAMNFYVLPKTVEFQFTSTDPAAERERVELAHARARERALRVTSGELTPIQALKLAVAEGDAPESFLQEMAEQVEVETDEEEEIVRIVRSIMDTKEAAERVEKQLVRMKNGR